MKKIFLSLIFLFLLSGCSLFKDDLEDAKIYTTVYPIKYLTEELYGKYGTVESIYPTNTDVNNYELTEKQIKNYAKADLFIYDGLSDEKNIAKNLINANKNLLIIDVSYGLNYDYDIRELRMRPNNYLMLAKNIKDNLIEYLQSKYIIDSIEQNYAKLSENLSLMDADLQAIGKDAIENGTNTLIVNDDLFYYLQNYGFKIISLDPDTVTETTLNNIENSFNKKTYDTIIVLDNNISEELNNIITKYGINIINVSSMIDEDENEQTYEELMQVFIDALRNLTVKD